MNLHTVTHGLFKLDGGAMFGVVPKPLWTKHHPTDERNRCDWALRSLLIENGDRLMLIDCGMGDKQGENFFGHYAPRNEDLDHNWMPSDFTGGHHQCLPDPLALRPLRRRHRTPTDDPERFEPAFANATFWSTNATGPGPTTPTRGKRQLPQGEHPPHRGLWTAPIRPPR